LNNHSKINKRNRDKKNFNLNDDRPTYIRKSAKSEEEEEKEISLSTN